MAVASEIVFAAIFLCTIGSFAQSSTMFRGDLAHTGVYGSAAPKNIKHILWEFKTGGRIFSSPVVADGIVYVGSDDHSLHAIDARKGREIWKFQTEANVNSTPAVANGSVYVLTLMVTRTRSMRVRASFNGNFNPPAKAD
jgi:hypothetical protein